MLTFLLRPLKLRFSKDKEYYKILNQIFGIFPNNIELYKLALIHRSASLFLHDGTPINNERLEFLGDAIIESVVSDYLFIEFPDENEGFLTQLRSRIVSRTSLNQLAIYIGLDRHIIAQSGGNYSQKHLYGDALEAMMGAAYLDKGYDFVNRLLINNILRKHVDLNGLTRTESDFKSRLIEWGQRNKNTLHFSTEHSEKYTMQMPHFKSSVSMNDTVLGVGEGSSKKEAEQSAAFQAFEKIQQTNSIQ